MVIFNWSVFFQGEYPYVIINNLHRSKLDANRDKPEATFGEEVPEVAWNEYHNFIDRAKAEISGPGLFIDVHGHGHDNNWAELGYLIKYVRLYYMYIHGFIFIPTG